MNPDEFNLIGQRLFGRGPNGYGWKAAMHRETGAPLTSIEKWASGVNPIPAIVAWSLRKLSG